MKKKLFLTAGALVATATPIVAVVSCSDYTAPSSEDVKLKEKLDSTEFKTQMTADWQFKVLGINAGDKLNNQDETNIENFNPATSTIDIAKKIIRKQVASNAAYLQTLATKLINTHEDKITKGTEKTFNYSWMSNNGMKAYQFGKIVFNNNGDGTGVTDDAIKVLLLSNKTDFRSLVLKSLMIQKYLNEATKALWSEVYPVQSKALSRIQTKIKEDQFVIVDELLKRNYFAKWEQTPSKEDPAASNQLRVEKTFSESLTAMIGQGTFAKSLDYKKRQQEFSNEIFNFATIGGANSPAIDTILGYAGVSSVKAVTGSGVLDFKEPSLQKVESIDGWYGFQTSKDFIRNGDKDSSSSANPKPDKKIQWKEQAKDAKLTLLKGIMPIWDKTNSEYKLAEGPDAAVAKKEYVDFLSIYDDGLYSAAEDYFLTDKTGKEAVILKPDIQSIYDYLDKKGDDFKFIKKRNPEE